MNEYQRQSYLTSLGIENYMPRWRLIAAPAPIECILPALPATVSISPVEALVAHSQHDAPLDEVAPAIDKPIAVADMLRELKLEQPKRVGTLAAEQKTVPSVSMPSAMIAAFSLSIWRPQNDLLIIDSRNAQLALPTELLLQNILHALYGVRQHLGSEDVLRWPLVDNTFVSRTVDDARGVLQVWLEVELERRPVKRLLLMGQNAAQYFLAPDSSHPSLLFTMVELNQFSAQALISPSLIELLQQPEQKSRLWQALQPWRHPA